MISCRISTTAIVAAAFVAATVPAHADFVVSGYSHFVDKVNDLPPDIDLNTPPTQANAVINFAVYENTSGNWATALGLTPTKLGTPAVDTSAAYVYFYQVSNVGTSGISQVQIGADVSTVTSIGYISSTIFNDTAANGGAVGSSSNLFLGPHTTTGASADPSLNGLPTYASAGYLGHPTTPFTSGSQNPSAGSFTGPYIFSNPTGTLSIRFFFLDGGDPTLDVGESSSILFITSNSPNWAYMTSHVLDGGDTYNELPAPAAVPVPATAVLLISGAPGLLACGWCLRRRQPPA
jgi:hypothetical protein